MPLKSLRRGRLKNLTLSVIIPAFNEERSILSCIRRVRFLDPCVEIIVADGGSTDNTVRLARPEGVRVVTAAKGRGIQCNSGAACASGTIVLFLHADTRLPDGAFGFLQSFFQRDDVKVGTFRLSFDASHWLLKSYAYFSRFDSVLTRFGDQCIVVRRDFFDSLSGFPDWPLFEDVHFLRLARRKTRVHSFPIAVATSARRYLKNGIVRQQLRNALLVVRFLLKSSVADLARQYDDKR